MLDLKHLLETTGSETKLTLPWTWLKWSEELHDRIDLGHYFGKSPHEGGFSLS